MASPEPVVFALHFESLYLRAHGASLTPRLKDRLKGIGLDLDAKLLPAYPLQVAKTALQIAAEELHSDLPRGEALRRMGRTFIAGWQATLLGKAAVAMLRVVGPRRTLSRLDRAFRTGDNFTETHAEELSPTRVRVRLNEVMGSPDYYAGIFEGASEAIGARNARISIERRDGDGAQILVEWDE